MREEKVSCLIDIRYNDCELAEDGEILSELEQLLNKFYPRSNYSFLKKTMTFLNTSYNFLKISKRGMILGVNEVDCLDEFSKKACAVLEIVLAKLNIKQVTRMGMRSSRDIEFDSYNEIDEIMKSKFCNMQNEILSNMGDIIYNNIGYKFKYNEYNILLSIHDIGKDSIEYRNNPVLVFDNDIYIQNDDGFFKDLTIFTQDVLKYNYEKIDELIKKVIN